MKIMMLTTTMIINAAVPPMDTPTVKKGPDSWMLGVPEEYRTLLYCRITLFKHTKRTIVI